MTRLTLRLSLVIASTREIPGFSRTFLRYDTCKREEAFPFCIFFSYSIDMKNVQLILISGLPGAGKSTLAESLVEKLSMPLFSVDPIESSIIKSGITRRFETGLAAYIVAETLAGEQLKHGLSVIIDAVNPVQEARAMWHNLARTHHATLIIIECVLERELHQERIASRVRNMHGIPELTWQDVEHSRKNYLPWTEERLVLDTANGHEENVQKALDYIHLKG
ncbi:AAA family ATPase [Tengunoibacter tsumagoiensis]|uniref:Kinase n=1 Tax=Tengunoibacter tsumagoiensis TaxID=2014871 RepID=A0A402A865_9CHLR|nr:AAA family ATPase [Tengunoibacter tsumagoiensis]GCE15288.1 hypothetical protein KTT_51470 [Tengunoibacter tsumagoiensis]